MATLSHPSILLVSAPFIDLDILALQLVVSTDDRKNNSKQIQRWIVNVNRKLKHAGKQTRQ